MALADNKRRAETLALREANAKLTENVHKNGMKRHPGCWFHANLHSVNAIWAVGLAAGDPQLKALISLVILRTLDVAEDYYTQKVRHG